MDELVSVLKEINESLKALKLAVEATQETDSQGKKYNRIIGDLNTYEQNEKC